jgi:uncharacterized membrane protein YesL
MAKKEYFRIDNPVNETLTWVFNLAELNLLTVICALPVITAGSSLAAMYTMCFRLMSGQEESIRKGFFTAFKENFRKSIPYTVSMLVCGGILLADFHILGGNSQAASSVLYGCCIVLLVACVAVFAYALPLFSRYENSFRGTMNNAWRLAVTQLPQTILLLLIHCLPFVLFLFLPAVFFRIFWFWLIIGGSVERYLASIVLRPVFSRLEESNE